MAPTVIIKPRWKLIASGAPSFKILSVCWRKDHRSKRTASSTVISPPEFCTIWTIGIVIVSSWRALRRGATSSVLNVRNRIRDKETKRKEFNKRGITAINCYPVPGLQYSSQEPSLASIFGTCHFLYTAARLSTWTFSLHHKARCDSIDYKHFHIFF